jgi:WD40 repeat protein
MALKHGMRAALRRSTGGRDRPWRLAVALLLLVPGLEAIGLALGVFGYLSKRVLSVAFSADGKRLAATAKGEPAYVWDASTGKVVAAIRCAGCKPMRWGLALSPHSRLLAVGTTPTLRSELIPSAEKLGRFSSITVWRVEGPSLDAKISDFQLFSPESPFGIVFSPDGRYVAAGETSNVPREHLRIWDVATGQLSHGFVRSALTVASSQFSPDGRFVAGQPVGSLALVRRAPPLALWDLRSGKRVQTYAGCGPAIHLAFSPDGRTLAGMVPRRICLWDVSTGKAYAPLLVHQEPVVAITFIGETMLAAAIAQHSIRLWDLRSQRDVQHCHISSLRSPAQFSSDGKMLAFGDPTRPVVHLWDVQACKELRTFTMQPEQK